MAPCSESAMALMEAESVLAFAQEVALLAPKNVGAMGTGRWELRPAGPHAGTRDAIILQLRANYKILLARWKEQMWPKIIDEEQLNLLGNGMCANMANESDAPFRLYVARYGHIEQSVVTAFVEAAIAAIPSCSAEMRVVLQTAANLATESTSSTKQNDDRIVSVISKLGSTVKASLTLNIEDDRRRGRGERWDRIRSVVNACNHLVTVVREFHVPSIQDHDVPAPPQSNLILTTESTEWRAMRHEIARIFRTDYHRETFLRLWDAGVDDSFWSTKRQAQRQLYDQMVLKIEPESSSSTPVLFREIAHDLVDDFPDYQQLMRVIRRTELVGADVFSAIYPWMHAKIIAVRSLWSSVAFEVCSEISKETIVRELEGHHQSCLPSPELYQSIEWTADDTYDPRWVKSGFVGALINNRYKVTAHIGEGGFGHGWVGLDVQNNSKVFIKTFLPEVDRKGYSPADRIRMTVLELVRTRRLKGCKLMDSPYMVRVLDVVINGSLVVPSTGRTSDQFFAVITEFCNGGELFNYVVTKEGKSQSLSIPTSRYIFKQFLDMLDALDNAGYVHGDIKLENILVEEGHRIKLIDYGTVRTRASFDEWEVMATEFNHQTPQYRHPFFSAVEKHLKYRRSVKEICCALDMWACGLVLWHLLTVGELGETHGFDALQMAKYDVATASADLQLDPLTVNFLALIFHQLHKTPTVLDLREHPWVKEPSPSGLVVAGVLLSRFSGIEQGGSDKGAFLIPYHPCEDEFERAHQLLHRACEVAGGSWSVREQLGEENLLLVECWADIGSRTSSYETFDTEHKRRSSWVGSIVVTLLGGSMRLRWEHGSSLEEFLTFFNIVKDMSEHNDTDVLPEFIDTSGQEIT